MRIRISTGLIVLATAAWISAGASTLAAGQKRFCEAGSKTRRDIHALESDEDFHLASRKKVRTEDDQLLAKRPDDVFLHLDYIRTGVGFTRGESSAIIERYRELKDKHQGDSTYEFLYAVALVYSKTPEAIERLKNIPADAAVAPLAHLELADILEFGKFQDRTKAREELATYLEACPASLNSRSQSLALKLATPEMAAKYAANVRKRLENDTDPTLLDGWERLWNLEFLATPTQQEQVRTRIASDLQRLKRIRSNDLEFLAALKSGYKMVSDKTAKGEIEDRIVQEYPRSYEARAISQERFQAEHPYPQGDAPEEAEQAYYRALLARTDRDLKTDPGSSETLYFRFDALSELNGVSNDEVVSAGEALRAVVKTDEGTSFLPPVQFTIAREYVKRNVRIEEVPELVAEGDASYAARKEKYHSDRDPDKSKNDAEGDTQVFLSEASLLVDTARAMHKPEIAKDDVEKVSQLKSEYRVFQMQILEIQAKWAELEGRKLDALFMYKAALGLRSVGDKSRKKDEVEEAYARLWKELGGTEVGQEAWQTAIARERVANNGGWEHIGKDLPVADVADINGKKWNMGELKGKTLLVNVWATWCGPCRSELPYLQKLYDKVKDRKDIGVLTLSIDDEVGDVVPYMKEKNYSFPVLLASQYVGEVNPSAGVPQNWIVDANGKWTWMQLGFGEGEGWENEMLEKLEGKKEEGVVK
jgi:thiol-disulfide isomerase/thioredoxin